MSDQATPETRLTNESSSDICALIENARQAVLVLRDGNIIFANSFLIKLSGFTSEELENKPITQFIHDDDKASTIDRYKRQVNGELFDFMLKFRVLHKDGHIIWVEINPIMIVWNGQRSMLCFMTDVSASKQIEDELTASEFRFRTMFYSLPIGAAVTSAQSGQYLEANDTFCKIFGDNRENILGKTSQELHYFADPAERTRLLEYGLKNGSIINKEVVYRHRNGTLFTCLLSVSVFELNNQSCYLSMIIDISDKLKADAERQKFEQQIQQSQKLESLGVLAGGIAHDFNNLLSGIFGFMDLARRQSHEPAVNELLANAIGSIDRAKSLTQQLLTFAKGGAPARQCQQLFPFVEETARFILSGSSISLTMQIPSDLWPCDIDKNQIAQVIDNIVINAQQAMPQSGAITIAAQNVLFSVNQHPPLEVGRYVKISITDHGHGIAHDLLPRIFDPFFTTKQKGCGLGLATSYSIVKRHAGCIEVESEPGTGSVFHVYLPASSASAYQQTPVSGKSIKKGFGTILLMDDEEVVRASTGGLLKQFGYDVVFAKNGEQALQIITAATANGSAVRAAILDLTICGGMGGRETISLIRAKGIKIPVIVSSGYADDPILANPAHYGFTGSIKKPFTYEELGILLETVLDQENKPLHVR